MIPDWTTSCGGQMGGAIERLQARTLPSSRGGCAGAVRVGVRARHHQTGADKQVEVEIIERAWSEGWGKRLPEVKGKRVAGA